jgi:hypothetical protein
MFSPHLRTAITPIVSWVLAALVFIPAAQHSVLRYEDEALRHERAPHQRSEQTTLYQKNEESENPKARLEQEMMMLRNPNTGQIPDGIEKRSVVFAQHIASREDIIQSGKSRGAGIQAEGWTQRGPFNIGGRTRAFAIDVSNENIMLAGGISGGLWRSENGGQTWRKLTLMGAASNPVQNISFITQDTRSGKTNIWYASTGEGWGNSASAVGAPFRGDGVYKSTDGGRTWSLLASTATATPQRYDQRFDYTWALTTNPANTAQDEVYAALFACLKRSTDGGQTWRTVLGTDSLAVNGRFMDVAVAPRSGVVYATISRAQGEGGQISRGIFRSTDGVRWTQIQPPNFPTTFNRIIIGVAPSNDNIVYFLAETPNAGFRSTSDGENSWYSLWKYTYVSGEGAGDGGTWEDRSQNLPAFTQNQVQGDFFSQGSYNLCLKVHPTDENILFIGGTNLYRSNDAFATNTQTAWIGGYATNRGYAIRANHHVDQHVIMFSPNDLSTLYTANDGGIFRTNEPLAAQPTWTPLNNGYVTTQFYAVAIDPVAVGNTMIVGGTQDNGSLITTIHSPQASWNRALQGDGAFCAVGVRTPSTVQVYVSSQRGNVRRQTYSPDFSRLLSGATIKPSGPSDDDFSFINPFALDPGTLNIMYVAVGADIWRHNNLAAVPNGTSVGTSTNWTQAMSVARTASGGRASVTSFGAASQNGSTRLYVGTSVGRVLRIDNAHTGTMLPRDVSSSTFPAGGYVACIAADQSDPDRAIAVFSNYEVQSLFLTENGGTTWTAISGNLEERPNGAGNGPSCRWASILNTGVNIRVFVGTSTGLYSTERLQGAQTQWIQEGASTLGNAVVSMVATRAADGLVVAATHGNGIFSTNVDIGAPLIAGEGVILSQNYPNPFTDFTTFSYKLTEPAVVGVVVYDMLGKRVATIVNETQAAGVYQRRWNGLFADGVAAPSGYYVARLTAMSGGTTTIRTVTMNLVR